MAGSLSEDEKGSSVPAPLALPSASRSTRSLSFSSSSMPRRKAEASTTTTDPLGDPSSGSGDLDGAPMTTTTSSTNDDRHELEDKVKGKHKAVGDPDTCAHSFPQPAVELEGAVADLAPPAARSLARAQEAAPEQARVACRQQQG